MHIYSFILHPKAIKDFKQIILMNKNTNPDTHPTQNTKPVIGITIGDYNGIGPEVILKALSNSHILRICTPVIYGSMKILTRYRKLLELKDWFIHAANNAKQISHKKTNMISVLGNKNFDINPGILDPEAGEMAFKALQSAVEDLKNGDIDAIVTAPISKSNIQSDEFQFPGHTEYFTDAFGQKESLMLLVADELRVAVATGHMPLVEVSKKITRHLIQSKVQILLKSLKQDFGILKPKIAVLGFNPHAGEDGLLGDEEQQVIRPAILEMKKKGDLIYGPFPADGFFGQGEYKKFDAVLAMYHDQGLIPFKTLAFERGVNFTAGLPIVRTSPDHGTAFDIAGKGLADETSLREAIFLACDISKYRKEMSEIENEALKISTK